MHAKTDGKEKSIKGVDKNLSFLSNYVQESFEKGAQPYIPENERSGVSDTSSYKNQNQHDHAGHGLRFEAYELPKPSPQTNISVSSSHSPPTTDIIPVSQPTVYPREIHQNPNPSSSTNAASVNTAIKLRLDGVQKKWGKPSYSSSSSPVNNNTVNGVARPDGGTSSSSHTRDISYSHGKQQVETSAEKHKLAASLFGKSSTSEKKVSSSTHRAPKGSHLNSEKAAPKTAPLTQPPREKIMEPPPDLLEFDESAPSSSPPEDPFKQLEGLVAPPTAPSSLDLSTVAFSPEPDLAALYNFTDSSGLGCISSTTPAAIKNSPRENVSVSLKKGPNLRDALEKDSVARQVGVTPSGNNPNLFKDLLG
ncbi:AP-4 complex subunit epsilon [Platanthera guangdongensis]|uniref:AP-4 complex subunit epsilon n=1 Tax=Platanthera guangdongensis TaxID=2320717 RepID=A0ABR2LKH4_9ASPA